ncbi:MAG: GNAT family N-acetyltransferase [Methanosarcinales archaeon]|nr:MAG: GNAT family N-acetyltransferase [Methanosarcinales archaeon]
MKIARLAVDKKYERRGVGRFLLLASVGKALKISDEVGCRFITVDSKQNSIKFYEKSGDFKLIKGYEKRNYPTMYFDVLPTIKEMKVINMKPGDFQLQKE